MKLITTPAAYALTDEVIAKVGDKSTAQHHTNMLLAERSKEFKALKRLASKKRKIKQQIDKLENTIAKKFKGVELNNWGDSPRLRTRTVYLNKKSDIKNKLIVANHITGIAPGKLVDHVVKQLLSQVK